MCDKCDYIQLLADSGIARTAGRLQVLRIIGGSDRPLSAGDIHQRMDASHPVNRVTVYRILDLFVDKGIVERISGGGRSFFYGLAPNEHHRPHPHFYCTFCGNMECLTPESLVVRADQLSGSVAGAVEKIAIRVDGVCRRCLGGETAPS